MKRVWVIEVYLGPVAGDRRWGRIITREEARSYRAGSVFWEIATFVGEPFHHTKGAALRCMRAHCVEFGRVRKYVPERCESGASF